MPTRPVHFQFWRGASVAAKEVFYLAPARRIVSGLTVGVPSDGEPILLDKNGETTIELLTTEIGTLAGWEILEAPGELTGPRVFQVPAGEGTLEYADTIAPEAGAFLYTLVDDGEFPDDAPHGALGLNPVNGNTWRKR